MSASISNAQNPSNLAAQNVIAATSSSPGSSSNVAAGSAQPTARSSYANATKKTSSPPIASSAAPPVAVGGPQSAQHGKSTSISPMNGKNPIQPAVPSMAPTIVNSSSSGGGGMNGTPTQGDHSRKSSIQISAAGTTYMANGGPVASTTRAPSRLTFGAMDTSGSPAPSHPAPHHPQGASLNPQMHNPRVTSPAASPSPIPTPNLSGGRPEMNLPGRPIVVFGGGNDGGDSNSRPISMPPQPNPLPQAQHLRRESSQSAHSDMSNPNMGINRGFQPNGGRGRGGFTPGFTPQLGPNSPQPYQRSLANQPRGPANMAPPFPAQTQMHPNSPYRSNRSPAMAPAQVQQQAQFANPQGMAYGYPHAPYQQPVRIPSHLSFSSSRGEVIEPSSKLSSTNGANSLPKFRMPAEQFHVFLSPFSPDVSSANSNYNQYLTDMNSQSVYGVPPQGLDPYGQYYAPQQYGMPQTMHYPGAVPASPGRGHSFPQQMQGHYGLPNAYAHGPQAQGMSRSPSNVSERPPSAVAQPSTPAMTNVNHVSHTHTPSASSASPAPSSSNFTIPAKKTSKAIVIKNADGEVLDFNPRKTVSPAPVAQTAPPVQPRSPAIVSTPTPPPRAPSAADSSHSRTESLVTKSSKERRADFVEQFHQTLKAEKEKEEAEKKAAQEQEAKAKAEAEAKAKEEEEAREREEAEARAAKEKEDAERAANEKEAAEKARQEEAERLKQEEDDRMIAEMEEIERQEEERERLYLEEKKKKDAEKQARQAEETKKEEERLRQLEKEADEREAARERETPEQKAEREKLFASLKKNTQFGPGAMMTASVSGSSTPTAEPAAPALSQLAPPKVTSAGKPKPAALKLETTKPVEPAQPTAGMQALRSARFLQIRNEAVNYPDGIKSPNPALNQNSKSKGRQYDKEFLLQFQEVFKEKPSIDWDLKLKETVGDSTDSARPQSARTPSMGMGARQPSRPSVPAGGAMGTFGQFGGRTLPPGTTSAERFRESQKTMTNPLAQFVGGGNRPGGFPMGTAPPMARTSSFQNMGQAGPNSPRSSSGRPNRSGRGPRGPGRKEEEQNAKAMPLTAGQELKPLERSTTGWKPQSVTQQQPQQLAGHMPPDMVQRKVKAALNKMTPEKFDKIADQILEIAGQSKDENDGRTLRQVIQLTFEKACDEAHWASMYAKFCHRMLATMSSDIKDENVRDKHGAPVVGGALFRKYLLNRCQEEFERGWEVNLPDKPEGQTDEAAMLSDEYYIAAAAKRKGLGLIQFIGELYKLGMLTLRIMHECVLKLLDFEGTPDESAIESLVKLLRTVGATMEGTDAGPKMIAVYFERIQKIMNMETLPSRMRFMLLDTIDIRKAGWKSKDDAKGPKTLTEIHQEAVAAQQAAEMERTRSNQRGGPRPPIGRGDARSFSGAMMPPQDYPRDRVQMDDLRKLSKGASGRNLNNPGQLGPSMLGSRSSSGRRGLGPGGGLIGRGDESGASSRTATPPVQKEKESTTHMNSFSALATLETEGTGEVGSPPSTASSPPVSKSVLARSKSPAVEAKEAGKPSE
ncbi:uncharacterized protein BDR25DRAFT_129155 [Lindgomyces ingoldianus]|uniref:Uncharacterized protein n=1 Tax=Lindgomyces ingoldianus TaxID=673940 RepID=A0ACB6R1T7_9PLEO|nr:uncharacterized protein BDR25DRAFT_129155 [Lindgomyces ingoldianus]KAF2473146.1 hypothetical protein BDR25DRAFT_129155 [Lindgomyces ingoldianus]